MNDFDFATKTTKELEDRVDYLLNVAVEKNKARIIAARALGDFSENSEYDLAKREQYGIHCEIAELREELAKRLK